MDAGAGAGGRTARGPAVGALGRARRADRAATVVLWILAASTVLLLGAIIVRTVTAALGVLSFSFLLGDPSSVDVGGVGPILWNSIYVLVLALLIAVPPGVLAGIYMAEYARPGRVSDGIRFAQEAMSSIPSIVVGLFGLLVFVTTFHLGFSALSGALALALFNLPLTARLVERALLDVPADLRAGALALGATRWQATARVVLPAAVGAMATGLVLAAGRVFGEAAALIFTAGLATPARYDFANLNALDPTSPWSPLRPATTLAVHIWKTNSEGLNPHAADIANGAAAVLIAAVLLFNVAARLGARALARRTGGA